MRRLRRFQSGVRCADGWKGCQDDAHLDIPFEKLTPQPGVARLAFSKKILVIGLEFAKKNPIQSVAIAGSAAHTSPHEKTFIPIIARCFGNLLGLLRAEPFTC
jgi:hypothetical protein